MPKTLSLLVIAAVCSTGFVLAGCEKQVSKAADTSSMTVAKAKSPAAPGKKKVTRIVFIGQKQACDCTRRRIEASWKALETANATSPQVPVERIDWDVKEKEAEKYTNMKAMMVVPGIYFLNAKGALVEMLQGEVTADKISKLLQ